jgi:methyl-accepting chemotaxis protein
MYNVFYYIKFTSFTIDTTESETKTALIALEEKLESRKTEAANVAKLIATNQELGNFIAQNDRQAIINYLNTHIKNTNLDFVTVTDNSGMVLARMHEPEKIWRLCN